MPDGIPKSEQLEILAAIVNQFGKCLCGTYSPGGVFIKQCTAHEWLSDPMTVPRLAFGRAMRGKWLADEQTRSDEDPLDAMRRSLGW